MSASPLWDLAKYGPDASFTADLLATSEIECLADGGIGLLCRRVEPENPDADVMVTSSILHWSSKVLACARQGDFVKVAGRSEPVDAGIAQALPLLRVHNPARLEIWTRVAAGPTTETTTPTGGAAA